MIYIERSHVNSCYSIHIILIPSSIQVALSLLCFQASLVSCHEYWQKRAGKGNMQPLYIDHGPNHITCNRQNQAKCKQQSQISHGLSKTTTYHQLSHKPISAVKIHKKCEKKNHFLCSEIKVKIRQSQSVGSKLWRRTVA